MSASDEISQSTTPIFKGTAEGSSTVTLTLHNQADGADTSNDVVKTVVLGESDNSWVITLKQSDNLLDNATYQYKIVAEDKAGNISPLGSDIVALLSSIIVRQLLQRMRHWIVRMTLLQLTLIWSIIQLISI